MASITTTIASGGIGAALTIIIVKELARHGIVIDADETAAMGTVLASILHYVSSFLPQKKENINA